MSVPEHRAQCLLWRKFHFIGIVALIILIKLTCQTSNPFVILGLLEVLVVFLGIKISLESNTLKEYIGRMIAIDSIQPTIEAIIRVDVVQLVYEFLDLPCLDIDCTGYSINFAFPSVTSLPDDTHSGETAEHISLYHRMVGKVNEQPQRVAQLLLRHLAPRCRNMQVDGNSLSLAIR